MTPGGDRYDGETAAYGAASSLCVCVRTRVLSYRSTFPATPGLHQTEEERMSDRRC